LQEETLECFVEAFRTLGYEPCDDEVLEANIEKIAIYADKAGAPTHAARQLSSGAWVSKLGTLEDIEHRTLRAIEGDAYGTVVQIMRRVRSAPHAATSAPL
jgi:hypothetical protein